MTVGKRFKTGDRAPADGFFVFDGYVDGGAHPKPKDDERTVSLKAGATFPPIRSSGKACFWAKQR